MPSPPGLLLSALLTLGTSAGFAVVAAAVMRTNPATPRSRRAALAFGAFWLGACLVALSQGLRTLLALLRVDSFPLVVALEETSTPFYCLASAGLAYYVTYLLTGRERYLLPIAAYHVALWPALRYHVALARPVGYEVTGWNVRYVYETPLQRPGFTLAVLLLVLPLLTSILAYATLALRVHAPPMRYRIALVSIGLWGWIGTEALAFTTGLATTLEGEMARRVVALASVGVILLAYVPPRTARRRWGARNAFARAGEADDA